MAQISGTFVHPAVRCCESQIARRGLMAEQRIQAGSVIIDYAHSPGSMVSGAEYEVIESTVGDFDVQVDDDLYFVPTTTEQIEEADFVNHSCEPNCGFRGALCLVALRDIEPGEEITFDYAMSESADYTMDCRCGTASCRGQVRGTDWQRPELQARYRGYFSPYLEMKIT